MTLLSCEFHTVKEKSDKKLTDCFLWSHFRFFRHSRLQTKADFGTNLDPYFALLDIDA